MLTLGCNPVLDAYIWAAAYQKGKIVNNGDMLKEIRRAVIVGPIQKDGRNTTQPNTLLGHDKDWIFRTAIGGGQANFDEDIENLKPRDRAMLYAWFNQPGHLLELQHAFGQLLKNPADLHDATVIDVGCGPFTAGLALAAVLGSSITFRYFGVDTSQAMRELGGDLAKQAQSVGALNAKTLVRLEASLEDFKGEEPRAGWTFVVLSYLLASRTLNVETVVDQILAVCDQLRFGPVALLYTNSAREGARDKYPKLEEQLIGAGFESEGARVDQLEVGGRIRPVHYALFVRSPLAKIPLAAFPK